MGGIHGRVLDLDREVVVPGCLTRTRNLARVQVQIEAGRQGASRHSPVAVWRRAASGHKGLLVRHRQLGRRQRARDDSQALSGIDDKASGVADLGDSVFDPHVARLSPAGVPRVPQKPYAVRALRIVPADEDDGVVHWADLVLAEHPAAVSLKCRTHVNRYRDRPVVHDGLLDVVGRGHLRPAADVEPVLKLIGVFVRPAAGRVPTYIGKVLLEHGTGVNVVVVCPPSAAAAPRVGATDQPLLREILENAVENLDVALERSDRAEGPTTAA